MASTTSTQKKYAETYLGSFGALLPLIVMIGSMIVMSALGMHGTRNFWAAGYLSLIAGFLVYKDKKEFQGAVVDGIRDNVMAFMLACFLMAGVMSRILASSHMVDALLYLLSRAHVPTAFIPLICFLICVVLASATGSAATTVNTAGPVLVPLAAAMGVNINLACGAIMAGAAFGDNLAPISDTTIASSMTQEVDTMKVVKSRLKYSLIAGAAASVLFIICGFVMNPGEAAGTAEADASYLPSIAFLAVPVLAIVLMLTGRGLFTCLLISEIVGIIMLFLYGYITPASLVATDGILAGGFDSMVGSIIFIIFIFIMVSVITKAGVLDRILALMRRHANSDRNAEIAAGAMVCLVSLSIGSGTSAITFCGPIVRKLMRPFKIDRARCANLLDGLGCGIGYLMPTNAGCLNLAAVAVAAGVVSESYSPASFVLFNFHSIMLTIVFWFAILTGWGRTHETDEELRADGIDPDEV